MQITKIINKIRFKANDNNEIEYSDYDVIRALNDANRIFYDVCKDEAPEFIATDLHGILFEGDNIIYFSSDRPTLDNEEEEKEYKDYFDVKPARILEVRCDGRQLHSTVPREIQDTDRVGTPKVFTLGRYNKDLCLKVYPVPNKTTKFVVKLVEEVEELKIDGEMNLPADFIEYVVEFVAGILRGTSDVGTFKEAVIRELRRMTPGICVVDSYY